MKKYKLRIRDLREQRGFTQMYVSKILKCDNSLHSKYERGERELPIRLAIKLAQLYGVSVDYLIGLSNVPKQKKDKIASEPADK